MREIAKQVWFDEFLNIALGIIVKFLNKMVLQTFCSA